MEVLTQVDAGSCRGVWPSVVLKVLGEWFFEDYKQLEPQDECAEGHFVPKKVPRDRNPSDMLTKVPSAEELKRDVRRKSLIIETDKLSREGVKREWR